VLLQHICMQGHGCGVGYRSHPHMSAVCRDTQPGSSLQAGHIHVIMSLTQKWMAPLHTDRQTDRDIHSHTDAHLRTQTLIGKSCKVRQTHNTDTQKTEQLTITVKWLTVWDVTHASRSCQSVDGTRLCLVAIAQGQVAGGR